MPGLPVFRGRRGDPIEADPALGTVPRHALPGSGWDGRGACVASVARTDGAPVATLEAPWEGPVRVARGDGREGGADARAAGGAARSSMAMPLPVLPTCPWVDAFDGAAAKLAEGVDGPRRIVGQGGTAGLAVDDDATLAALDVEPSVWKPQAPGHGGDAQATRLTVPPGALPPDPDAGSGADASNGDGQDALGT